MKRIFAAILLTANIFFVHAQDKTVVKPRPLTMAEYDKAKTFTIKDLDKDTYTKFENTYILDRYEMRKPYIITGDDGVKKRIDLYKLILKDGMEELGTMVYYTNEKGKVYNALQPNFTADPKVWNRFFTDIDNINKEEKNFVLKLSYVLSKEMSFQLFKAMNNGKDVRDASATYGTDICFPGNQQVAMANGSVKQLSQIKPGDQVITVDPVTKKATPVTVQKLQQHEAKNYALTKLIVGAATERQTATSNEVKLSFKILSATPNHPVTTTAGKSKIGEVAIGDQIICFDDQSKTCKTFTVYNKTESAGGVQKVYNMVVNAGSTYIMNGVMVMQK